MYKNINLFMNIGNVYVYGGRNYYLSKTIELVIHRINIAYDVFGDTGSNIRYFSNTLGLLNSTSTDDHQNQIIRSICCSI